MEVSCELQAAGSCAAVTDTDAHLSAGVFRKSSKKFSDPQSTVFHPRVGKRFRLRSVISVKAQGGGISPLSLSISVGMQIAFPKDFTADKYDVVNDCSGTTRAVNHTSISGAFRDPGGPLLAGIQPLATSFPQEPTFPGRGEILHP